MTKKQRKREAIAKLCEEIIKPSQQAKHIRATNRRIEMRKGKAK